MFTHKHCYGHTQCWVPAATSKAEATALLLVLAIVHRSATESCQEAVPVESAQWQQISVNSYTVMLCG